MKLLRGDWFRVLLILMGGTVVNNWGLSWIPFHKLPLSQFWWTIIARSCSALLSLALIRLFCPSALKRFGWGGKPKNLLISLVIVAYLMGSALWQNNYHGVSAAQIVESFIFALFIGIDEDFFSRGFIFGGLERYGVWLAAVISSVHFGLLHLPNIIYGGQSAAYTLAQAVSAGAFGFLAAALMVYSGTIWVPILMHGLCDFPMQFDTASEYKAMVTGGADWTGVLVDLFLYSSIGVILILLSNPKGRESLMVLGSRLGLVDPNSIATESNVPTL